MSSIYDNRAYRARILHLLDDPASAGDAALQYFEDGILWIQDGKVRALGPADQLLPLPFNVSVREYPNHLIIPGFIDAHVHYPQTGVIASHGNQLLDWLTQYTFPAEAEFGNLEHAREMAEFFLQELLRNGTTTAAVFCTVHPQSVNALFAAAKEKKLCLIAGKVLMDRNAPPELLDESAECSYEQSKKLIERWHNVDRLRYAVTPRFAPTSSPEQLQLAGKLLQEFPDLYLHTHLAENQAEIDWVKQLFPTSEDYLQVYEDAGLVGRRSVFAHGVHLCDSQCQRLAQAGATVAHCPTSNLFLGSGLFNLQKLQQHGVNVAMGTDVGGGTSFSLFRTLDEAYKIQQLQGFNLDPLQAFYYANLGAARALDLPGIGNLQPGNDGDFVILDLDATPLLAYRLQQCRGPKDLLFVLNTLGDDRLVQATYAAGQCVHRRAGHG